MGKNLRNLTEWFESCRKKKKKKLPEQKFHIGLLVITEQFVSLGEEIRKAVKKQFGESTWVDDFSDSEAIISVNKDGAWGKSGLYAMAYDVNDDGSVTLSGSPTAVERKVIYEGKAELKGAALLKLIEKELRLKK